MLRKTIFLMTLCFSLLVFPKEGWMSPVDGVQVTSELFSLSTTRTFDNDPEAIKAKRFETKMTSIFNAVKRELEPHMAKWKREGYAFVPIKQELKTTLGVASKHDKIIFTPMGDVATGPSIVRFDYDNFYGQGATAMVHMAFGSMPPKEKLETLYHELSDLITTAYEGPQTTMDE